MSKIICDICGTSYPDTAECCPICGCSRDAAGDLLGKDLLDTANEGGDTVEIPAKRKEIFDFDEVNADPADEEESYDAFSYEEGEEEDEEPPRQNIFVVIVLTVLIALLLMAAGFIFIRYFLPGSNPKTAAQEQTYTTAADPDQTTELSIPCAELYVISGKTVEINKPGGKFLLHVKASPENTTDKILYTSADESIATVTEDGRVTAVSEGETVITIRCGVSTMECTVTVKYIEETVPPTTEAPETVSTEETTPVTEGATETKPADGGETSPAATEAPAPTQGPLKKVTLRLKKTDIRLGVYYEFKLLLDCDLEQNEVQWSSEHPHIATVDENGVVKAIKAGTTAITATYGDQKVQCIVRCS